ncbi:GNAT family N-acetyltransferase [Sesbania bispinosa]|nr:GNAT family N-acetyltransferase [Sesbania bispinosa]
MVQRLRTATPAVLMVVRDSDFRSRRNSDDDNGCSRTEYAAVGAERHEDGCDGGLKRLLVSEGMCYMHRGSGMTVMMAVWLHERERHSCGGATVNATGDRFGADGGRSFLERDKPWEL